MLSRTALVGFLSFAAPCLAACGRSSATSGDGTSPSASPSATPSASARPGASASAARPAAPLASRRYPDLLEPSKGAETAPPTYKATVRTSAGDFVVEVHRDWAPNAADRFYDLAKRHFFDDTRFHRVLTNFLVEFGISGDPLVNRAWRKAPIPDDPVIQHNLRGFVSFAPESSSNRRSTEVLVNLRDNRDLDAAGYAPFGEVVTGMDVMAALYDGYGEGEPQGQGPNASIALAKGNAFLDANYPRLSVLELVMVGGS